MQSSSHLPLCSSWVRPSLILGLVCGPCVYGQEPTESHGAELGWGLQDRPRGRWPVFPTPGLHPSLCLCPAAFRGQHIRGWPLPCSRRALPLPLGNCVCRQAFYSWPVSLLMALK